jgi:hypothetical protein
MGDAAAVDDRRRIELQIRAVAVTYRSERRRLPAHSLRAFGSRARAILVDVQQAALRYPDLAAGVANLIEEIDRDERLAAGRLGEETVDGGGELVDVERLG